MEKVFQDLLTAARAMLHWREDLSDMTHPALTERLTRLRDATKAVENFNEPRVVNLGTERTYVQTGRGANGVRALVIQDGVHGPLSEKGIFQVCADSAMPVAQIGEGAIVLELPGDTLKTLMLVLAAAAIRDDVEAELRSEVKPH